MNPLSVDVVTVSGSLTDSSSEIFIPIRNVTATIAIIIKHNIAILVPSRFRE